MNEGETSQTMNIRYIELHLKLV